MFPILMIALGVAVLLFGNRLPVLGAAVGALVGAVLLRLFPGTSDAWVQLAVVGGLALLGLLVSGFARGIIDIVILVLGALAGAGIVLGFLDLFNLDSGLLQWILAVAGGVAGLILIRRGRRGDIDYGMIILASLVGALLVVRGLSISIPALQGGLNTLIVIALAALGFIYQSGLMRGRGDAKAEVSAPASPPAPTAKTPEPSAPTVDATQSQPAPPKSPES